MANQLKMALVESIITLHGHGWSQRRIARELGYQYAVLFANEMGHSPYFKLGFQDMGRRISRYFWRAEYYSSKIKMPRLWSRHFY